jgi:hypothetical protein
MTRSGKVSDDLASDWLDLVVDRCTHIGVGSSDPFAVMDPLTVEPAGGVYHRAAVTWTKYPRLLRATNALAWPGLPIGTVITWYLGWDAFANGNLVFACPSPLLSFPSGGGFEVPAGDFFFGIDT